MYQLTVLHNIPADRKVFDAYYDSVHLPLAKQLPGVRRFTVSRPAAQDGVPAAYHVVAVLEWDDEKAYQSSMNSAEGQAALADLPNFTAAGITLLPGEIDIL
ncbi:EthD family reductase [Kribbella sp. NPDC051587]|uniref:EthD family reductase n=1 Tax=Kribbella sp. NPDC051587 TaxID=3364119 RepID=UPI0037B4DEEF